MSTNNQKSITPLIAGTLGGAASTILLYPLDLIKVRLQVNESSLSSSSTSNLDPNHKQHQQQQNILRKRGIGRSSGNVKFVQMIRGVIRHEGLIGLYSGMTPAIVGSAVSWGGYFFIYEGVKQKLQQQKRQKLYQARVAGIDNNIDDDVKLGPMDNFSAACLSGAIMVGFTNPIWLIKTRMQLQMKLSSKEQSKVSSLSSKLGTAGEAIKPPYKNMVDAAQTIIKEEGFKGLYKGSIPALMLVSHGGVQFVCYEFLKGHFGVYQKSTRSDHGKINSSSSNSIGSRSVFNRLEDSLGYLTMGAVSKMYVVTLK